MSVRLVYVAGPYRSSDPWRVEQNTRAAEALAYDVASLGAFPVCPHANTRLYMVGANTDEFWLAGTLQLMRQCDGVILLPNWHESSGTRAERAEAVRLSMPIFESLAALNVWLREVG